MKTLDKVIAGLCLLVGPWVAANTSACTLNFTSPGYGASVTSSGITVFGQGGADAKDGDSGTVTASLNSTTIFNYSGSFTAAVNFLESRGVGVSLRPGNNFFTVSGSAGSCSASDTMTVFYDPAVVLAKNLGKGNDDLSCHAASLTVADPISTSIGNVYEEEQDYKGGGSFPLRLVRSYNSLQGYWITNYSSNLVISANAIVLVQADGQESPFSLNGNVATPSLSERGSLVAKGSQWQYTSAQQEVFDFDATGRLVKWTDPNGQYHALSYANSGLITVSDASGNEFTLTQDRRYQPLSLTAPGLSVAYTYDATARLQSVAKTQGGSTLTRQYLYENTTYPRLLTGLVDERGVRVASWAYDDQGRAITNEQANGVGKIGLAYNVDGSTTVTNELSKQTTYRYQVIQGIKRIVAIEGEPSPNCPASNSTYTYNDRGQVLTKTDAKGFVTTYTYNDRGLETSQTEGSGATSRTVTTEWDATRFLPTKVIEPNRTTLYTYDSQGRRVSQVITPH